MTGRVSGEGPRASALRVLKRVYGGGAYADIVLASELERLPEGSRPLATELVYGVLRHQTRLDWVIDAFSSVKTKKLEHEVLYALRLGIYQLAYLTSIPAPVAINETVALVKSGGAGGRKRRGFVNAVLRKASTALDGVEYPCMKTDPVGNISVVYSHPEWLVRRWVQRYGVEFASALCSANADVPPRSIRVNTLKTSVGALKKGLSEDGVEVRPGRYSPEALTVSGRLRPADDRYYVQDEASQLIAHLLSPAPGEMVLDACAAPGGKATHMAALMENRGVVYALDRRPGRVFLVKEGAKRLGADMVKAVCADSSAPLPIEPPSGGFDAVLLDAPCSGLGVLRRSPDIKLKRAEEDIARLALLQGRLISNLAGYVRPGGRLVYSVCTFEPEETESVVKGFVSDYGGFEIEDAGECLPEGCAALVDGTGFLRSFPHLHGLDGFFAARLRRV